MTEVEMLKARLKDRNRTIARLRAQSEPQLRSEAERAAIERDVFARLQSYDAEMVAPVARSEPMIPVAAVQALRDECELGRRAYHGKSQWLIYASMKDKMDALIATAQAHASDAQYPCGCSRNYCPTHKPSYLPDQAAPSCPRYAKAQEEPSEREREIRVCSNPAECCRELSRVWVALGVKGYTGHSASEHGRALREETDLLRSQLATALERERKAQEENAVLKTERDAARKGLFSHLTGEHQLAEPTYAQLHARLSALREALKYQRDEWNTVGDNYSAIQYEYAARVLDRLLRDSDAKGAGQ